MNIINGYGKNLNKRHGRVIDYGGSGNTVGEAMSMHQSIRAITFTGSTLTGRRILKASAESNLKKVALELGGKSPTIVFDDADLEQAIKWASRGILCVYLYLRAEEGVC